MKKAIALSLSTFLLALPAFAEVKLLVDDNIKVTAINGQEVRNSALQPLKREFKLDAGRHVITARYDRLFDLPRGDHDYLKSSSITLTADLADAQTYQLVMPNQPNNYRDAQEYVKAPTLAITANGKVIAQESTTNGRTGILSSLGNSIGGMFGVDNGLSTNQQTIAALNQASAPTANNNRNKLDEFMQLWLNATPEEREKIRQWVEQ